MCSGKAKCCQYRPSVRDPGYEEVLDLEIELELTQSKKTYRGYRSESCHRTTKQIKQQGAMKSAGGVKRAARRQEERTRDKERRAEALSMSSHCSPDVHLEADPLALCSLLLASSSSSPRWNTVTASYLLHNSRLFGWRVPFPVRNYQLPDTVPIRSDCIAYMEGFCKRIYELSSN